MKKLTALWLGLAMVFSLAACGRESPSSSTTSDSAQSLPPVTSATDLESSETGSASSDPAASASETDRDNILVVYFSATGNTEEAASYIADLTGGDLFELEPTDPYTSEDLNWSDDSSRVSQEYDNEELREVELVANTVDNWDAYDTVFIGYPIWWGIAAWPVDGFVTANDFTGKTVIPFCTSSSSGLGRSGELLAELAGTGDWQEGMRFRSSVREEDVQTWLNGLNLS